MKWKRLMRPGADNIPHTGQVLPASVFVHYDSYELYFQMCGGKKSEQRYMTHENAMKFWSQCPYIKHCWETATPWVTSANHQGRRRRKQKAPVSEHPFTGIVRGCLSQDIGVTIFACNFHVTWIGRVQQCGLQSLKCLIPWRKHLHPASDLGQAWDWPSHFC